MLVSMLISSRRVLEMVTTVVNPLMLTETSDTSLESMTIKLEETSI